MIRPEKYNNALYAIHLLIVKIRLMAYQEANLKEIATIADYAEILPRLINAKEDKTEEFRKYLIGTVELYPLLSYVLRAFDDEYLEENW